MVCTFYKSLESFLPWPYGFGMVSPMVMECMHLVFPDDMLTFTINPAKFKQ